MPTKPIVLDEMRFIAVRHLSIDLKATHRRDLLVTGSAVMYSAASRSVSNSRPSGKTIGSLAGGRTVHCQDQYHALE
jgi:hypothetical protein